MDGSDVLVLLTAVLCLVAGGSVVHHALRRRAAWNGLTARGRVVRAWETTETVVSVARRVRWHEYEFTTHDGRVVRFTESGGPSSRAPGDEVPVHYAAAAPKRATTSAPRHGRNLAGAVLGLACFAAVGLVVRWWVSASGP
ncbi:DUF3592 domain-containing protein [Streptomyces sp. NPDC001388]|uniref:DUF3592 domain-containing protein n=1 Tax=Streptomyces sp. NPDC001388 TaxID=3364568 RepID=UPI0036B90BC7